MNTILEKHVLSIPNILNAYYESSSSWQSPHDLGKLRECFIKNVLKFHLPSIFEITSGEIIDSKGNRSKQQDIVIYRRDFPKLSFSSDVSMIFIEGVNSTFEIKSSLNYNGFKRAVDNIISVKKLISKIQPLAVGEKAGYIFSYIFIYSGPSKEKLMEYFEQYLDENKYTKLDFYPIMPDAIYVLDKYLFYKNDGFVWKKSGDEIIVHSNPKVAFSKFFFHILITATRSDIYSMDWGPYFE